MSNVVLDAVLVSGNTYSLVALPSSLAKAWEAVPNMLVKDEFVFLESYPNTVNAHFRHVRSGVVCKLPTNLFLDHSRYYYPTNEKNAVKKALYICTDTQLYPYGSSSQLLRQAVKAGTIFTSYQEEGSFYIVKDNQGNRLRAYKTVARPIVDIEDSNTNTVLNTVKESQPVVKNKTPTSEIKVVATYAVLNQSFSTKKDADFVADLLSSIADHVFEDSTAIVALKQLIAESVEINLN